MPKPKRTPRTPDARERDPAAEWVALDRLKPWPKNPRKNDGAAVARVVESIQKFGFGAPIVARKADGEIIAGHTRYLAAKRLKLALATQLWGTAA